LPDILQAFKEKFPDVKLLLRELASYDQLKELVQQQIDVGFLHAHNLENFNSRNDAVLVTKPVLQESLVVVLPTNHRFASHTCLSL